MSDKNLELAFAEQRLAELEQAANMQRSQFINHMLNVRVMLEEGSEDKALEYLKELTE